MWRVAFLSRCAHALTAFSAANVPDFATPYDWTFSTAYCGTLCNGVPAEDTSERLDIELLKRQEPILFYDEVILFEDELADNGSSQLSVKLVRPV